MTKAATTRPRAKAAPSSKTTPRAARGAGKESVSPPKSSRRSGAGASALYVYGLVKSARPLALAKVPRGLEGTAAPRALDAGGGWSVLATDAPLSIYAAETIDAKLRDLDWVSARAGEHDEVLEHALSLGTVVPLKLFTLFSNEERAIAHVKKSLRSLDRVAERIAGCEEWSLRILLDEARARARAAAPVPKKKVSGTAFLERKKAIEDTRRKTGIRGAVEAEQLFESLSAVAKKSLRRPAPNRDLAARVFLDAVFLVPNGSVKKLQAAVAKVAPGLVEEGFDITLSGPWPAYSFIS